MTPAPASESLDTILHVEDNEDDHLLIARELRRQGVHVARLIRVDNEADFLPALEQAPDLVLCDFNMPRFDPLRALEIVRSQQPDLPFIIISGSIGDELAVEVMRRGATDYLLKDRLGRLGPAISSALEQKRLRLEQVKAHEQLRRERDRLTRIAEAAPSIIYSFRMRPDGSVHFPYVSNGIHRLFGVGPEQLQESVVLEQFILDEDLPGLLESMDASRRELTAWRHEFRVRSLSSGEVLWVEARSNPVREEDGSTVWHGVLTDITERRSLEAQYRQAQKMEAFGQLAGGVAHDFNNLLTVMNGYADLLGSDFPDDHPAWECLSPILEAGARAAELTSQLLAFSRKTILQPQVFCLNDTILRVQKMLSRLIGEDIALQAELEPELPNIQADPGQLEQVIVNLAVNARDAMPLGGLLTLQTLHQEGMVHLIVSDTGTGIPAEIQHKIFEPFFTTKPAGKGTGLGLASVYGAVTACAGQIAVRSTPGEGTTFNLAFPVADRAAAQQAAQSSAPVTGCGTILLVEDEEAVRAFMRVSLERCGYTVLCAGCGEEAVNVAAGYDGKIDLVIADVVMPGMESREMVRQLRHERPRTEVLYVSGYTDDITLRRGILADDAFLHKPFSAAALCRKVHSLLVRC